MLGWMLKRGEHAQAADAGDTTQLDQPDTPAPVFAARAFKSALFGTPAPAVDESRNKNKRQDKKLGRSVAAKSEAISGTPTRPPGILLTLGTGATRRKRVSFGNDVEEEGYETVTNGAVDFARLADSTKPASSPKQVSNKSLTAPETNPKGPAASESDSEWEEEEYDYCTHDITLDINEPHSQSGRFWKGEFEKYHREAKAEMEKLLKYKQLAKSYARQKDAEAIQLAERLRDEQKKVIEMEKKIAEQASHIVSEHRHASDADQAESMSKLSKQTAVAAQYRQRVQELEHELDSLTRQKDGSADDKGRRRRQVAASPTTQKTLVDTQRELRRARSQLKELDSLRQQVATLKTRVKDAEAKASARDRDEGEKGFSSEMTRLREQLDRSREESRRKTEEVRRLKSEYDAFQKESEIRETDTKAVLERANAKIADLKKEIRALRASGSKSAPSRPSNLRSSTDVKARELKQTAEDESVAEVDIGYVSAKSPRAERSDRRNSRREADKGTTSALAERTNLGKPGWQPFVPRSPRRARLGESHRSRRSAGAGSAPVTRSKALVSPERQPTNGAASSNDDAPGAPHDDDDDDDDDDKNNDTNHEVDLLQHSFKRLGAPDVVRPAPSTTATTTNTAAPNDDDNANVENWLSRESRSKSSFLPPERQAAALARIEKRRAEKRRAAGTASRYDQENVHP